VLEALLFPMTVFAATMRERHHTRKGKAMIKNTLSCAAAIGASSGVLSSPVAQANPATPMPVIESSATQLCGAINRNPPKAGVMDGLTSLQNRGLDKADGHWERSSRFTRLPAARGADGA
jgi:hypothetical protein